MQSIKTAVVVSILLVVGYAVYTTLNNERPSGSLSSAGDDWPGAARPDAPASPDAMGASPLRHDEKSSRSFGSNGGRPAWDFSADSRKTRPGGRAADVAVTKERGGARGGTDDPFDRRESPSPAPSTKSSRTIADEGGSARQPKTDVRPEFREMMEAAQREIQKGSLVRVLRDLTPLYGRQDLSREESRQLTELLSQLAGEVVYSRQHYLQEAYVVRGTESLQQIAEECRVPWQLLANINGIRDPDRLAPGTKLKVLRGPFDAVVFLDRYELVLQIDGLYAGRFPIGIGTDSPRSEGTFVVQKKMTQPTYYGPNGTVRPDDPENPLGKYWIGLDERVGIHGTNDLRNLRRTGGGGGVCLGDRDIEDLYDILSAKSPSCPGSKVTFRRSAESAEAVAGRDPRPSGRR